MVNSREDMGYRSLTIKKRMSIHASKPYIDIEKRSFLPKTIIKKFK